MLRILKQLPHALIDREAHQLADALGGPALIHIEGERKETLFVSVLLHGNETTGWQAIRAVLARYQGRVLPRSLDLFIGNVHAARSHLRRLDAQPDFNRIWDGYRGPEADMVAQVLAYLRLRGPVLALDIHNTSGRNPLYACCHRPNPEHLALARSFSDTVVMIERPKTLLGIALASLAPAITMECGRPGVTATEQAVADYVERIMEGGLPTNDASPDMLALRNVATIRVPMGCSFSYHEAGVDVQLVPELDLYNFTLMPPETRIAWVQDGGRLEAMDEFDRDVADRYFCVRDGEIVTREALMPSLLTLDERIIRQDCLGYVMVPMDIAVSPQASIPLSNTHQNLNPA